MNASYNAFPLLMQRLWMCRGAPVMLPQSKRQSTFGVIEQSLKLSGENGGQWRLSAGLSTSRTLTTKTLMPMKSKLDDIHVKSMNLYDLLTQNFNNFSDQTAITESETRRSVTYRELNQHIYSCACWLQSNGCVKGDIVFITIPNGIDYSVMLLAAAKIGAITTGCDAHYTKYEINGRIENCQPKFIVATYDYFNSTVKPVLGQRSVEVIITDASSKEHGYTPLSELLSFSSENANLKLKIPHIEPREDLVLLPYSSGTTGKPKGVMITHYNIGFVLQMLKEGPFKIHDCGDCLLCSLPFFHAFGQAVFLHGLHIGAHLVTMNGGPFKIHDCDDPVLCSLPFFHVFGQAVFLHGLHIGAHLITMKQFHKNLFLENIRDYKIKSLYAVPPMLVLLSKDPAVSNYDLASLETIEAGAAPIGKSLTDDVRARLPNLKFLLQAYGMTECSLASHMTQRIKNIPYGSIGQLINNYEAMIIDPLTGKQLGENEDGELWIRSEGVMKGYWNRPDATKETVDTNGWLHTGDIGHYDKNENFYIVDRLKELIKVKGFQVAPAELEDIILSVPGVSDVGVIGIPNEMTGELPLAFVVRKQDSEGKQLAPGAVKDWVNDKVANYKHLSEVKFIDAIPKSPSGKILRRQLRELVKTSKTNQSKL